MSEKVLGATFLGKNLVFQFSSLTGLCGLGSVFLPSLCLSSSSHKDDFKNLYRNLVSDQDGIARHGFIFLL